MWILRLLLAKNACSPTFFVSDTHVDAQWNALRAAHRIVMLMSLRDATQIAPKQHGRTNMLFLFRLFRLFRLKLLQRKDLELGVSAIGDNDRLVLVEIKVPRLIAGC